MKIWLDLKTDELTMLENMSWFTDRGGPMSGYQSKQMEQFGQKIRAALVLAKTEPAKTEIQTTSDY